jgi:tRNA G26 N,N-dimethylase Trm1
MVDGEKVKQKVFYNPVQVFNRDLSLLVTLTHAQTIRDERL